MIRWKARFLFIFLLCLKGNWAQISTATSVAAFSITKDSHEPWSKLHLAIPARHPLYKGFQAKVQDVTDISDFSLLDENRTFEQQNGQITISALNPGHKYTIAVVGLRDGITEVLKEESVEMEPITPQFTANDVIISMNNITLITDKNPKHIQDSFRIEYRQIEPEKKFPTLEVLDIPEQKQLEVYLGNLSPGRDYSVKMTAFRNGIKSRPWTATLTTKPSPIVDIHANDNASCIVLKWTKGAGGADSIIIDYRSEDNKTTSQMLVDGSSDTVSLCDNTVTAGGKYFIKIKTKKNEIESEEIILEHQMRPAAPMDIKVRPDISKGKYGVVGELNAGSQYHQCHVVVVGENLEKLEENTTVNYIQDKPVCIVYLPLTAGDRFEFSFWTSANGVPSTKIHRNIVLTPAFDMKGFGLSIQESKGGLEMSWPQSETFMKRLNDLWNKVVGHDSLLQLRVASLSQKDKIRQFESSAIRPAPIFVSSLTKGACYKVQLYTVTKSGIVSESRFDESVRISPPPVDSTVTNVTRTSALLNINLIDPKDNLSECHLTISVLDMNAEVVFDRRLALNQEIPMIELNGLRPFHQYTVNTQIVCGLSSSTECAPSTRTMRQANFATKQDKPGPVTALAGRALNPYSIQLNWLAPALPNGIVTQYIVQITPLDKSSKEWTVPVSLNSARTDNTIETIIDGLTGGEKYNVSVRAVTEAGPGELSQNAPILFTLPIMAPPRPTVPPQVILESIGPQSLSIRYSSVMFDAKHGRIIRSALIVAEVTPEGEITETWMQNSNQTYTWLQVQRFDHWPEYTAAVTDVLPQTKNIPARPISEAVGVEESCEDLPVDTVCNGPLKAGALYKFKLRVYTAPHLYSDSPYSEVVATERASGGVTLRFTLLLLAALFGVGLIAFCILTVWNRTKKIRNEDYSTSKESQWAALKMIMAERAADCLAKLGLDHSNGERDTVVDNGPNGNAHNLQPSYAHRRCRSLRERTGVDHRLERLPSGPIKQTPLYTIMNGVNIYKSRPVRKVDFEVHIRTMSADSEFRFSEEYESLKNVGIGQSYHASDLNVNRVKNRFSNILAYDHSRVKIITNSEVEGADYVNANYIPGYSSRKEFIAAQGPMPNTVDSFWLMVWQQQCPAIMALTKCVEKGRDKCHKYWPDQMNYTTVYGEVEVTVIGETHFDDYTIRDLRLENIREGGQPRIIRHFHYMAWPDFGVPEHPEGIIRFARLFRAKLPHSPANKPTIVHCSAGVGRSGTFITIDRLLQQIMLDRPIDVYGIVYEMRLERCHMVQNEQQYIFIHHCILHALKAQEAAELPIAVGTNIEIHQNPAFHDDEGVAESGF